MSKLLAAIFVFALVFSVWSCKDDATSVTISPQIEGTVYDDETNEPIQGATITTVPASVSIMTDANGKFLIKDLNAGEYTINAEATGYYNKATIVATKAGIKTTADIKMRSLKAGNTPPNVPVISSSGIVNNDNTVTATLTWSATDPESNSMVYDVYWGDAADNLTKILSATTATKHILTNLIVAKPYFWKVVATDIYGASTSSEITQFSMTAAPGAVDAVLMMTFDGNTNDYSPNKLNGTGEQISYVAGHDGKANGAVYFSGNNSIVTVPYNAKMNLSNSYTIALWIKPNTGYGYFPDNNPNVTFLSRWYGGVYQSCSYMYSIHPGTGIFRAYHSTGTGYRCIESTSTIPVGVWTHIAFVFSNQTITFYMNGDYIGESAMNSPLSSVEDLTVGGLRHQGNTTNENSFTGSIDNLYIYNKALTAQEIAKMVSK